MDVVLNKSHNFTNFIFYDVTLRYSILSESLAQATNARFTITMRRKQKSMKIHATIWEVQIVRALITRILNNGGRKNHVTGKWGNKYNGDKHSANTL